jgi:dihydrofolate reductase
MFVSLIVAMDNQRGIGRNNDLMWHLPRDMRFFREITLNNIVIMGRKNYDSIPLKYRPLERRENVILTRNTNFQAENCKVFHSLEDAFSIYNKEEKRKIFIIGGGQIYKEALYCGIVSEMYITKVHSVYDADTFFPSFDESAWNKQTLFKQEENDKHESAFSVYRYYK